MRILVLLLYAAVFSNSAWAVVEFSSFADPTPRYDHGILGDAIEYGALILKPSDGSERKFILPLLPSIKTDLPHLSPMFQEPNTHDA